MGARMEVKARVLYPSHGVSAYLKVIDEMNSNGSEELHQDLKRNDWNLRIKINSNFIWSNGWNFSQVFKTDLTKKKMVLTIGMQGQMSDWDFDQDLEEWLERLPNQLYKPFDTGVGGYT
jgi:hypothetical protein